MTPRRSLADLVPAWHAHAERTAPTSWRTSRSGRPTRRIAGGVTVAVEYDRRRGGYRLRFDRSHGVSQAHATERGAMRAADAIEAHR